MYIVNLTLKARLEYAECRLLDEMLGDCASNMQRQTDGGGGMAGIKTFTPSEIFREAGVGISAATFENFARHYR